MTQNPLPPFFTGTTSGPLWWHAFTRWVIGAGRTDPDRVLLFETVVTKPVRDWFKALAADKKKTLADLREAFETQYPGAADEEEFFLAKLEDPRKAFTSYLARPWPKDVAAEVEVELRDETGNSSKEKVPYFQEWARQAYHRGVKVNKTDMSNDTKGLLVRGALPDILKALVPKDCDTLLLVCKTLTELEPSVVHRSQSIETRLFAVEQRSSVRQNTQSYAPSPSYQPAAFVPVPQQNAPQGQPAPATGSNSSSTKAVRAPFHLVFPNDAPGCGNYQKAMEAYNAAYGTGMAVSASRPYPLKPGTLAPGHGVCNSCGMSGHLQGNCNGVKLDEREQKYRGINSAAQRREDQATMVRMVADSPAFNPHDFYHNGTGNGEVLA